MTGPQTGELLVSMARSSIGFGGTPTSIFAARKSQVSIHLPCLPLMYSYGSPHKNNSILNIFSAFSYRKLQPYSVFCVLFLHGYALAKDIHTCLQSQEEHHSGSRFQ